MGFFGSYFESDFIGLEYRSKPIGPADALIDRALSNRYRPKILAGENAIDYFFASDDVPDKFTQLQLVHSGERINLGLKISPHEALELQDENWDVEISIDLRLPSFVSLLKSAHLTLFELLGYQYAISAGGHFVGKDILGRFFLEQFGSSKAEALASAEDHFSEFYAMVRPVLDCPDWFTGTVLDGRMLICRGDTGIIWGMIVLVPIMDKLHGVVLPVFDNEEAVPMFLSFLGTGGGSLQVSPIEYDDEKEAWFGTEDVQSIQWPAIS